MGVSEGVVCAKAAGWSGYVLRAGYVWGGGSFGGEGRLSTGVDYPFRWCRVPVSEIFD